MECQRLFLGPFRRRSSHFIPKSCRHPANWPDPGQGGLLVPRIPAEDDEDRFAVERVFAKKMANAVLVERTDNRRIYLSLCHS